MGSVLSSEKIKVEALNNGFKFLEQGKYNRAIKFLKYVDDAKVEADEQYLKYGLALAYYNTGDYKNLFNMIEELKKIPNLNEQIGKTISDLERELTQKDFNIDKKIKVKTIMISSKVLITLKNSLKMSESAINEMGERTNNKFYKFLANPEITSKDSNYYKKVENEYMNSLILFEKVNKLFISKKLVEKDLIEFYKKSVKGEGHSLFIIALLNHGLISEILKSQNISYEFKNILLSDLYYYNQNRYITISQFEFTNTKGEVCLFDVEKFNSIYSSYINYLKKIFDPNEEQKPLSNKGLNTIKKIISTYYKINFLKQNGFDFALIGQKLIKLLLQSDNLLQEKDKQKLNGKLIDKKIDIDDFIKVLQFF